MDAIATFVQQIYNEDLENVLENEDYSRRLKGILAQKPFLTNVNWKGNYFVLNTNRKSADFEKHPELLRINGVIMQVPEDHKESPEVVAYSFNTIRDATETFTAEIKEKWNDYTVEPITDGAIIRVWWHSNKWNISTIKCIDAHDASWSNNKSFYDLFDEASSACEFDYTKLNKTYCYTFVLRHPENHMIIEYKTPSIMHLCTVDVKNPECPYVDHDIGIPQVNKIEFNDFQAFEEALNAPVEPQVLTSDHNLGFILTHKTTFDKYKFESPCYARARELKGNVPNIRFRIIELIKSNTIAEFLKFFPQYANDVVFVRGRMETLFTEMYAACKAPTTGPASSSQASGPTGHPSDIKAHTVCELQWIIKEEKFINYGRVKSFILSLSTMRIGMLTGIPYLFHQKQFRGKRLTRPRYQFIPVYNKVLTT